MTKSFDKIAKEWRKDPEFQKAYELESSEWLSRFYWSFLKLCPHF